MASKYYLPVVSALALAAALVGAGLMSDGCVEIVNVLHRHDITVSYLFRYYLHTLFAVLTLIHMTTPSPDSMIIMKIKADDP